jgi:selenocysteine lyase/cysteine desulfurase
MELYERNYGALLGLGEAAWYAHSWGLENIDTRNIYLATKLRDALRTVKGITIQDRGKKLGGIVTFTFDGKDHRKLLLDLRAKKIQTSVSFGGGARRDLGERGIESVMRASVHYYNTEEEIELLKQTLLQY